MQPQDLLRELKRTVDELQALNDIGRALTSTLELPEVLHLVMQKVSELLRAGSRSLLLLDEAAGELYSEVAVGPGAERLAQARVPLGDGIAGWVAREGQPVLLEDARTDARYSDRFDALAGPETRCVLAVPLLAKGRVLGVIELAAGEAARPFSAEDLLTLRTIADYAAIAIDNAQAYERIKELTVVDDHTGLYNARHLYRTLESEVARGGRYGRCFSVVFLDLDRFKDVNDRYGHQVGSAALREVGDLLRRSLRSADVAVRYGGDEFVLLLPEADREQALGVAERIRARFEAARFLGDRGLEVQVTASIGVATFPEDGDTPEAVLGAADAAMYRVKQRSRNGVEAAGAPPVEARGSGE
ncbi:MAG TPA: sensor domain-containing diguanylate cyclase [Anaeromyxobacteraceae bacterium]|nr:sensor domain-containing diguanylate cyclase [Anaeromyxobacteraceae bacterium]